MSVKRSLKVQTTWTLDEAASPTLHSVELEHERNRSNGRSDTCLRIKVAFLSTAIVFTTTRPSAGLMDALLQGLNNAQKAAVTSEANVLQVLAPPGSGKTKTLTARVSYLITQCGLKPWNIIVCTFTVKSAREMKERIKDLVGGGLEKKLVLGTFHSVARRFLVTYGQYIGLSKDFGIADTADTKAILKRIIKDNQLTIEPSKALARISSNKAKSISSDQFAATAKKVDEQEFTFVYSEYEAALKLANLLDYDDLLLRCAFLLRTHPLCVSNIEAVLIDEFQDTNEVQFQLMTLFAQQKRTITIVGDPDQSIYGWRNAEIKNLQRMKKQYPDTLVIFLEENYRSSGAILDSAQRVIEQDETRPAKRLQATHGVGEPPILRRLPTAEAEAKWLVSEIQRTQALTGKLLQYTDFAVLLRSAQLSRHIESALGNAGIPYRMVGGTKFYDRVEVKIILDYLRVINQPDHNDALLRIINVPSRGIGEVTVKGLLDESQNKSIPLWKVVLGSVQGQIKPKTKISSQAEKGLSELANIVLKARKKFIICEEKQASPVDMVEHLLKRLDFEQFLRKKYPDDFEARWANVEELKAQTADLSAAIARGDEIVEEENLPEIDGVEQRAVTSTEDALAIFLANIALTSDVQRKNEENAEESQCITISTIHAAKGLEWPVVFLPACYDGSIPHSRAEDNDEERRLLYVGMTRAQAILYLSCPTKNSQTQDTTLSVFLTQQGVELHFSKQGPSLEYHAVGQIAQTLRRDCPIFEIIKDCKCEYGRTQDRATLEDDYWPLDGTPPLPELSRWDYGKASGYGLSANRFAVQGRRTERSVSPPKNVGFVSASSIKITSEAFSVAKTNMKPVFISAAASRQQNLEEAQQDFASRRLENRTQNAASAKWPGKKGPKVATGASSITSYFANPHAPRAQPAISAKVDSVPIARNDMLHKSYSAPQSFVALSDITNSAPQFNIEPSSMSFQMLSHKPRNVPMMTKPRRRSQSPDSHRHVISSSPPRKDDEPVKRARLDLPEEGYSIKSQATSSIGFKPASTFHTTSMTQIGTSTGVVRRTLGLGKCKPWSSRAKR